MRILILTLALSLTLFGQKGSSSRSYSSPSRSSSTYSSGKVYSSQPARSSTTSSTPQSKTYTSGQTNRQAITSSSKTYTSRPLVPPSKPFFDPYRSTPSSRTYYSRPPVYYGGRTYVTVPYYHPYFMGGGYYASYGGGGIPWWGWLAIMHSNQQPVAIQSSNGSTNYVDAGTNSFNFTGLLFWIVILCLIGWLVYALVNRDRVIVHRHY